MRSFVIPLVLALSACSLTPALDKPPAPVPAVYPVAAEPQAPLAAERGWRLMFPDARLQRLIGLALAHNRDLRVAALNVQAVRAQYGIARAAHVPAVEASGTVTRQRTGDGEAPRETRAVGLAVPAFESDLFGRLRAQSDAALARYLASEQGARAVQLALVGSVAEQYFAALAAGDGLRLAERTLADWDRSLQLARGLRGAGQTSGLDIVQAEGQVASAQADVAERTRAVARARNALALLLGTEVPDDLPAGLPLEQQPARLARWADLPADLLTRRPDILQAEQELVAANAEIGAARAAFFPRLSLAASLGDLSPAVGRTWTFVPQITQPLFQGGRLRGELRLAELRKSSAIAGYERAIQSAFREVADALAGQATYDDQIAARQRALALASRRVELSTLRYRSGMEGRLELLDAQRQLYAAQGAMVELRLAQLVNAVGLYKALGGGESELDAPKRGTQSSG